MSGTLIQFCIGYFLWKYVPMMITSCPKKLRMALEISGIVLMVLAVIGLAQILTGAFNL